MIAVKCPWKKYVLLPEGCSVSAGDDCICPAACPKYKTRLSFCSYACFTAKKDSAELPEQNAEAYEYSREEIKIQFPDYAAETPAPDPVVVPHRAAAPTATNAPTAASTPEPVTSQQSSKYVFPHFGAPKSGGASTPTGADKTQKRQASVLTPKGSYSSFELRAKYYTLDGCGRSVNIKDAVGANELYRLILTRFDVQSVFDGNDLNDNFLWVLDNTLKGEKRERAARILQAEGLDYREKFFLLFYGAIFFDAPQMPPLYWSSGFSRDLKPIYIDRNDFYRKVSERSDGNFYNEHSKLVLFWLKKLSLTDIEDSEKVNEAIRKVQEEVALDPASDVVVFWSSTKFVCLGRKDEFVRNLTVSDKSTEELESTAEFLSRFDILKQGGRFRIVKREVVDSRTIAVEDGEVNDDVSATLFSSERSSTKLEHYLYIVKRYCRLFRPSEVKIGDITFEEGLYTERTENAVLDMCAYVFGDASLDEQKRQAYNMAQLAKLLYKKAVLFDYSTRLARSEEYMNAILDLVSDDGYTESDVLKYFEVCKANGIADKIKLYSFDCSVIPRKAKMLNLQDWIVKTVQGAASLADLCSLFKLPVFAAYKSVFGASERRTKEATALYNTYVENEKKILNIVAKLK